MTSTDWTPELQEALWETAQDHGVRMSVSQQVAVVREIAREAPQRVTAVVIRRAFVTAGLDPPSEAYAKDVVSRIRGVRVRSAGLREVLLSFRERAIRDLSRQFGGKKKSEDALRTHLLLYLPERGYAEARTGRGQTDILLPPPVDAVIETKVWTSKQRYEDGMDELAEYIRTEKPRQAYMVLFCDRDQLPPIVADHRQAIGEERELEGLRVPAILVPFDVDPPSKVSAAQRRRNKGDG